MMSSSGLVRAVCLALAIGVPAGPLTAQSPDGTAIRPPPQNPGLLLLAGGGGMIVGALGGALIGIEIDDDRDFDTVEGAVVGGLIGTTFAIPAAVHMANGRRGNLGRSMLVSALVGAAMFGLGWAVESGEIVIAAPVAQLITAVTIERTTSR